MKSYRLDKAGLTKNGVPFFKFDTQLHDGIDLDGKFKIQFAAIEKEGEPLFTINSPRGLLAIFNQQNSKQLSNALYDKGEYIVYANYENKTWEEHEGYTKLLMGRDFGQEIDYKEKYQLAKKEHNSVKEISELINS